MVVLFFYSLFLCLINRPAISHCAIIPCWPFVFIFYTRENVLYMGTNFCTNLVRCEIMHGAVIVTSFISRCSINLAVILHNCGVDLFHRLKPIRWCQFVRPFQMIYILFCRCEYGGLNVLSSYRCELGCLNGISSCRCE